jgi:hypothetical protein
MVHHESNVVCGQSSIACGRIWLRRSLAVGLFLQERQIFTTEQALHPNGFSKYHATGGGF